MTISQKIKEMRKAKSMSLRDFGKLVDCDYSYLSRLESGIDKRSGKPFHPTMDILKQICDKSNYDFRTFLEETGYLTPAAKFVAVFPPYSTADWTAEEMEIIQKIRILSDEQKQTVLQVLDISYNAQKETKSIEEKRA